MFKASLILLAAAFATASALAQSRPVATPESMIRAVEACIAAVSTRSMDPILRVGNDGRQDPDAPLKGQVMLSQMHDQGVFMRLEVVNEGPNNKQNKDQYQCDVLRTGAGQGANDQDNRLMAALSQWAEREVAAGRFQSFPPPRPKSKLDRLLIQCRTGEPDIAVFVSAQGLIEIAGSKVIDLPDGSKRCVESG